MTTRTITKTLLNPDPDQARAQLDDLARELAPEDAAAGERLRAVAVELVRRGLEVTVVDYQDPSQELEVVLPQARHLQPVTIDRDDSGTGCHLAWEQPMDIADVAGAGRAAGMVVALLPAIAAAGRSAGMSCCPVAGT
jgi:hypothetical protein